MGISIPQWRVKIGAFSQPVKSKTNIKTLKTKYVSLAIKIALFYMLVVQGIESNPGPGSGRGRGGSGNNGATTRRATLSRREMVSQFEDSTCIQPLTESLPTPGSQHDTQPSVSTWLNHGNTRSQHAETSPWHPQEPSKPINITHSPKGQTNETDMFSFLRNMRSDLLNQNERVSHDINNMNSKIDSVLLTVNELKSDYQQLKQDNISLQNELSKMKIKLDQYENNSRRNNLRLNGISGRINEQWSVTEEKLRNFLRTTLNLGEQADLIDIDRAHRVKSNNASSCTIIARFVRFKDCQNILDKANAILRPDRNSQFSVHQDFSDRVKHHRKVLGDRMMRERNNGHYASIRYDKLFVNDSIYKYDDQTDQIVYIGKRTGPRGARGDTERERGNTGIDEAQRTARDQRGNQRVGDEPIRRTTDQPDVTDNVNDI